MPAGFFKRFLPLLVLMALLPGGTARPQGSETVIMGPVQDVALLEDFGAGSGRAWTSRQGENVRSGLDAGYALPGVSPSLMRLRLTKRDAEDREPSHNWFVLERKAIAPDAVPPDADGLRLLLGSQAEAQWWISVGIVAGDGETYARIIDHPFPAGRIVEYTVPFSEFRSPSQKAYSRAQAGPIRGLSIVTGVGAGNSLYLDRITVYRRARYRYWLDFTTSHPENNLFQRTDPVDITFTPGGALPATAWGFRYEVRDYDGRIVRRGAVPFSGAQATTRRATPPAHGYYEVRAYLTDAAGRDLEPRSCLRAEGTVPAGMGTFSVLPSTLAENVARFQRMGDRAFFGLHGDFLRLADYVGLAWRFDYSAWRYLEPVKPDRAAGLPDWARERLAAPPMPAYRLHIQPFLFNLRSSLPDWAQNPDSRPPAFRDWADALAMVRDQARVEKHLYPQMRHRIYGGAWEVNLNMPPYVSQPPEFTPADVATLYRRVRAAVKAEDPDALLIGPCPSTMNTAWFETVFKAGVLESLDGIETHGYNDGVFTPEENDLPGKIARLNALVRRYHRGQTLPIYCTERGDPGVLGSASIYREQAQKMVRAAIILKGEGVRVFLPFYGIDYDRECYGFCFNKDVDAPSGPWATRRISPKPLVNAMAACVNLLEGAAPKARLRTLGKDVWGYVFTRPGATITALWTTGRPAVLRLPAEGARRVEVVDFMGHAAPRRITAGNVTVSLSGAPVYIVRQK